MKKSITNWGNYPIVEAEEKRYTYSDELSETLNGTKQIIGRGNGRCYGDASLSSTVISTLASNCILEFDEQTGIMNAQSGLLFEDILDVIVPAGWFLPVTPGTKFITLGGALASDVHGKNHHVDGIFSDHVLSFELQMADGSIKVVDRDQNPDIFYGSAGGMGLTGLILTVRFKLKKIETSYIQQIQIKAKNLDEIMNLFEQNKHYTYSMAWIDCLQSGAKLGRSIFIAGEHATQEQVKLKDALITSKKGKLNVPFNFPNFVLNRLSIKLFNKLYYFKNLRREINNLVHFDGFFYPLDKVLNWNRMYGKRGFVQYQFVLPIDQSREGLKEILERINQKGWGSFLAVLKLFGKESGIISFPMEGYTLALDFPIRPGLLEFLDELDELVSQFNGRIYLSKDARMSKNIFENSYPQLSEFKNIIRSVNPNAKYSSQLSQRLMDL